ncbi:TPA: hypothetical protein ACGORM_000418 [Streptococcus suis]
MMNPLGVLFNYVSSTIGVVASIGVLTFIIKLVCIPLRVRRYKRRVTKQLIRKIASKTMSNSREFRKKILKTVGIKFFSTDQFSWIIDFILIILLLRSIRSSQITSFSQSNIAIVYLVILIFIEFVDMLTKKEKIQINIEMILKLSIILLLYYISLTTVVEIIVYWCFASVFNFILDLFIRRKYKKATEEEIYFIISSMDGKETSI